MVAGRVKRLLELTRIHGIGETGGELFDRGGIGVDGLDVDAGNHAVAHAQVGEIEGVLKELELVVGLGPGVGTVGIEQGGQIVAAESGLRALPDDGPPEQTENTVGDERSEPCDGKEQEVEKEDDGSEGPVIEIGVVAEDGLGQELGDEDDDERGNARLDSDRPLAGDTLPPQREEQCPQKDGHVERIDDQRDVVADENGGDVLPGMAGENLGDAVEHAALLAVDLQLEPVLAGEGDLHAREKGGEQEHRENQNNGSEHDGKINGRGTRNYGCRARRRGAVRAAAKKRFRRARPRRAAGNRTLSCPG